MSRFVHDFLPRFVVCFQLRTPAWLARSPTSRLPSLVNIPFHLKNTLLVPATRKPRLASTWNQIMSCRKRQTLRGTRLSLRNSSRNMRTYFWSNPEDRRLAKQEDLIRVGQGGKGKVVSGRFLSCSTLGFILICSSPEEVISEPEAEVAAPPSATQSQGIDSPGHSSSSR